MINEHNFFVYVGNRFHFFAFMKERTNENIVFLFSFFLMHVLSGKPELCGFRFGVPKWD